MPFDGTTESCPNYIESTGVLNREFTEWSENADVLGDPLYGKKAFNETCFNICATEPSGATYISDGKCFPCLTGVDINDDSVVGSPAYLKASGQYKQCNVAGDPDSGYLDVNPFLESGAAPVVPDWFSRQQDANMSHITVDGIDWSSPKASQYWKQAQRAMTNNEILMLVGRGLYDNKKLPDKYMKDEYLGQNRELTIEVIDFVKLRKDINDGRGNTVNCTEKVAGSVDESYTLPLVTEPPEEPRWTTCEAGTAGSPTQFGPADIVPEEVEDFVQSLMDEDRIKGEMDFGAVSEFSSLLSGLQYDQAFEQCINDTLSSPGDDYEAQDRIAGYESIKEIEMKDIDYIKKKLMRIRTMRTSQVNECMNLLNLGKGICQTGIADKTLMIGSLVFNIVGNDKINILESDNEERYKLNKIVDEVGPLIPGAIKNIIHVSKEYETRICNAPSNTTLLLERLYVDLYDKQTNITLDISPYIDFESLINTRGHWHFFKKMTVLIVFAYLFMQFTNLAVAFLSRGQTVTKIV